MHSFLYDHNIFLLFPVMSVHSHISLYWLPIINIAEQSLIQYKYFTY